MKKNFLMGVAVVGILATMLAIGPIKATPLGTLKNVKIINAETSVSAPTITATTAMTIPSQAVYASMLASTNAAVNGYLAAYDGSTGKITWTAPAS